MNADKKQESAILGRKGRSMNAFLTAASPPFSICVHLRLSAVKIK